MGNDLGLLNKLQEDVFDPSTLSTDPLSGHLFAAIKRGQMKDAEDLILQNQSIIHAIRRGTCEWGNDGEGGTVSNPVTYSPVLLACEGGHFEILKMLCRYTEVTEPCVDLKTFITTKSSHGMSPFLLASWGEHIEIMEFLVHNGASDDICSADNYWMTPLHDAVEKGNVETLKWLLKNGASSCVSLTQKRNGSTPFATAVIGDNIEIANILLLNGAAGDINCANLAKTVPLHLAKSSKMIQWLYENGAKKSLNLEARETSTGVLKQKKMKEMLGEMTKSLSSKMEKQIKDMESSLGMDAKAETAELPHTNYTPLALNILFKENLMKKIEPKRENFWLGETVCLGKPNSEKKYKVQKREYLDVNDQSVLDLIDNETNIVQHVKTHHTNIYLVHDEERKNITKLIQQKNECIETLLELGAKMKEPLQPEIDQFFLAAAAFGNLCSVKNSLLQGANILAVDSQDRWSAMFMAASKNYLHICKFLYSQQGGASLINLPASEGHTPVTIASQYGSIKCLRWLAENGADLRRRNLLGLNGISLACISGHVKVLKLFKEFGFLNDMFDNGSHKSPMQLAVQYGCKKVVKQLYKWGVPLLNQANTSNSPLSGDFCGPMFGRETPKPQCGANKKTACRPESVQKFISKTKCSLCAKEATPSQKLLKCSKCPTYYCGKQCQKKDWKRRGGHKQLCKSFRKSGGKFPNTTKTPIEKPETWRDVHSKNLLYNLNQYTVLTKKEIEMMVKNPMNEEEVKEFKHYFVTSAGMNADGCDTLAMLMPLAIQAEEELQNKVNEIVSAARVGEYPTVIKLLGFSESHDQWDPLSDHQMRLLNTTSQPKKGEGCGVYNNQNLNALAAVRLCIRQNKKNWAHDNSIELEQFLVSKGARSSMEKYQDDWRESRLNAQEKKDKK